MSCFQVEGFKGLKGSVCLPLCVCGGGGGGDMNSVALSLWQYTVDIN